MNNNTLKVKKMTGIGVLTAATIVLQALADYIPTGLPVNFTLALTPIIIGAIIYGPKAGGFLGLVFSIMCIFAPGTIIFMEFSPFFTIITCVLKGVLSGVGAGIIYRPFKEKKSFLGTILASISTPIINTLVFSICALTLFLPLVKGYANEGGQNVFLFLITVFIGINFLIELLVNSILSPCVYQIIKVIGSRKNRY